MARRVRLGIALLLLGLLATTTTARPAAAQARCSVPAGASSTLAEVDPAIRLAFIQRELGDQAARARLWSAGWAAGGLGLTGYGLVDAALQKDHDKRTANIISSIPSLSYPLEALFDPPRVIVDSRLLGDLLRITASPPGQEPLMDTCILLSRAEWLLAHAARDERARVGLVRHGLGFAVAIALGAIATFALHDPVDGALDFVGSIAISELHLWMAPTGAATALARYRDGALALPAAPQSFGIWVPLSF